MHRDSLALAALLAVAVYSFVEPLAQASAWDSVSFDVSPFGLADAPSYECCTTNSANFCADVPDQACDNNGVCKCCPNGGGINITEGENPGDPSTCMCGFLQTCGSNDCKNIVCHNGYCDSSSLRCVCNPGWGGSRCDESVACCESTKVPTNDSLCQLFPSYTCHGDQCYCCSAGSGTTTFNETTGQCFCHSEGSTQRAPVCATPSPDPCAGVHCGVDAFCRSGTCRCVSGHGPLDPKTNSCIPLLCRPECGLHGTCDNGTCICSDDFKGDDCKEFHGWAPIPPLKEILDGPTTSAPKVFWTGLFVPAVLVLLIGLGIYVVRVVSGRSAQRQDDDGNDSGGDDKTGHYGSLPHSAL